MLSLIHIFTISYRSSQIDEAFTKNEEMKQAYLAVEKENDQIKDVYKRQEYDGKIEEIFVKDGEAVDYGKPLFRIV